MLTRNQIKYINSLSRKAVRMAEGKFVVEGIKLCEELLNSGFMVEMLYVVEDFALSNEINVPTTRISNKDLERISQLKSPNKMLAVVQMPALNDWGNLSEGKYLFLDRINDPGNLGTIIRMADWFGIERVFCTNGSVDAFNHKTIQSSMGSAFRVPVNYVDGEKFLQAYSEQHTGHQIWSAEMDGAPINTVDFSGNGIIVMGSESHGVHPEINKHVTQQITIPAYGNAESLNVGVAAGIVLWEMKRGG